MTYSFHSILFNGREVMLNHILDGSAVPGSPFEASSFAFIRQWCDGTENFTQQTSGSTGIPKFISIARAQMIASASLTQQALQLKAGDTALVCLDPDYIAGKMMFVRSFVTDMKIVAVNPSSNPFQHHLNNSHIDFAAFVPAQLLEILQSVQRARLNELKNIIVGGAALHDNTIGMLSAVSARVFATYGMTETVSHIALQPVNGPAPSEYFKILPGIEINADERGCLQISAPYLNEKITTNDIVEIKSATEFKWIGRSDHVINSGGIKIIPEKVESEIRKVFSDLQIQNRFLVSSVADPVLGNKLILIVEGNLPATVDHVRSYLKQVLPSYHIPKQFFVDIEFVMTENGKINREETRKKIGI